MTTTVHDLITTKERKYFVTTEGNTDCWGNVHQIDCGSFSCPVDAKIHAETLAGRHGYRTYHVRDEQGKVIASYR
jgi:hypothetical protein